MTIDVQAEWKGLRATLLIVTSTVETHSAFQEIKKETVERFKGDLQATLTSLLQIANDVKKS